MLGARNNKFNNTTIQYLRLIFTLIERRMNMNGSLRMITTLLQESNGAVAMQGTHHVLQIIKQTSPIRPIANGRNNQSSV